MTFIKLRYFLAFIFISPVYAQNQVPKIYNFKATSDTSSKKVTFKYDLEDHENDSVKISLQIYDQNGKPVNSSTISGEVGFPVMSGKQKSIVFSYKDFPLDISKVKVKIIADDLKKVDIIELVNQVDISRIQNTLSFLYGPRDHETKKGLAYLNTVRDTIRNRFMNHKLAIQKQDTSLASLDIQNLIGYQEGGAEKSKVVILGAHYDAVKKTLGADDNASGVTGVLEAMRILSQYNFTRSLKFVCFDLEEAGFLGSKLFVLKSKANTLENIEGVINLDMIGYYSEKENSQIVPEGFDSLFPEVAKKVTDNKFKGDFAICTSNKNSKALSGLFNKSVSKYVPGLKVNSLEALNNGDLTPNLAASDHLPFWIMNYSAIHIGDGGESRNLNLNSKNDTIDTINYEFMSKIIKATVATLAEVAGIQHSSVASLETL